jgi:hypothetical protein
LDKDRLGCRRRKKKRVAGDQVSVFDIAGVGGKRKAKKCGNDDISHEGLAINVWAGF